MAYPGGESDTRNNCGESSCDFGPFTLTADEGNYGVTFCSDYANYTVNVSTWDPLVSRTDIMILLTQQGEGQGYCNLLVSL